MIAVLVVVDQWSKSAAFDWVGEDPESWQRHCSGCIPPRQPVLGDWLGFRKRLNYGSSFGFGEDFPLVLIIGRFFAVLFLSWALVRRPRRLNLSPTALVLITAGALGNLYDNLVMPVVPEDGKPFGPVRDFIDVAVRSSDWHFATFNFADACISVGAGLLLVNSFFGRGGEEDEPETETEPEPEESPTPGAS